MLSSNTVRSPHRMENIHSKIIALGIVKVRLAMLSAVDLIPSPFVLASPRLIPRTGSHCFAAEGMESHARVKRFWDLEGWYCLKDGSEEAPELRG
jgi:hypothetical protein